MKLTVTVPADLVALIQEALESGEYESAEQVVTDGLYLWADMVETAEFDGDDAEEPDPDGLLKAMEAKAAGTDGAKD